MFAADPEQPELPASLSASRATSTLVGRGRSGVVYLGVADDGRQLACKVFGSQGLTKIVQWLLLGAPNPYQWNEDAVRCAFLRRRIVDPLLPYWFGEELRLARATGFAWNEHHRGFELQTELSSGRAPALHHPRRMKDSNEYRELLSEVMLPLQAHLIESGFDGLVWQAGKGNPVALNNFLLEDGAQGETRRWVWIDLESGVPALIPLGLRPLFGYYLPRSLYHRTPLFDDVDIPRLREYLAKHADRLSEHVGASDLVALHDDVAELERAQTDWKTQRRYLRGIGYRRALGDIDDATAESYRGRPLAWYTREIVRTCRSLPSRISRLGGKAWGWLRAIPIPRIAVNCCRFLTSQRYRAETAQAQVARRIDSWCNRSQMSAEDAAFLRSHLEREESSAYLADFGVHIAIKPFVKAIEYWLAPLLFAFGVIDETVLAVVMLLGGSVARTAYTSGRLVQSVLHRREKPWAALVVGVLPIVGNFAYPLQIAYSSTEEEDDLARFILYDGFASIGRHFPIWGGADTHTEHAWNRFPERIMRKNGRRAPPVA